MELGAVFLTTIVFIILDSIWFSVSLKPIYEPTFLDIQGSPLNLRMYRGLVTWFLLALGIRYFAIDNNATKPINFLRGAFLGAIIYGVYNGTNYATLTKYPISTAIADTLWGAFAMGLCTVISSLI